MFPGLAEQLRGVISSSDEVSDISGRINALEEQNSRIERMLESLCLDREIDTEGDSAIFDRGSINKSSGTIDGQ